MEKLTLPHLPEVRDQLEGLRRICQDFGISMPDLINFMVVEELHQIRNLLAKINMNTYPDRVTGGDAK